MSFSLQRLLPLFERERTLHQPMVLATVVRSAGPAYTRPGAHMLLAGNGEYAGLVSGGYLEGELAEHGRAVLAAAWRAQRAARLLLVVNSEDAAWPPGAAVSADDGEPFGTNAIATERVAAGAREAALAALRALAARLTQERCSHFLPQAVPGIDALALSQPRRYRYCWLAPALARLLAAPPGPGALARTRLGCGHYHESSPGH